MIIEQFSKMELYNQEKAAFLVPSPELMNVISASKDKRYLSIIRDERSAQIPMLLAFLAVLQAVEDSGVFVCIKADCLHNSYGIFKYVDDILENMELDIIEYETTLFRKEISLSNGSKIDFITHDCTVRNLSFYDVMIIDGYGVDVKFNSKQIKHYTDRLYVTVGHIIDVIEGSNLFYIG